MGNIKQAASFPDAEMFLDDPILVLHREHKPGVGNDLSAVFDMAII
jgi:hypothetical protein